MSLVQASPIELRDPSSPPPTDHRVHCPNLTDLDVMILTSYNQPHLSAVSTGEITVLALPVLVSPAPENETAGTEENVVATEAQPLAADEVVTT